MNVMNEFILRPLRVVVRKASEVRRRTLEFESRIEIAQVPRSVRWFD